MKKVTVIVALAAFAISAVSCTKCVTCTYTDNRGEAQTAESCGKSNNEELEADLGAQWGQFGTVSCSES